MKKSFFLFLILVVFLFSGCSSVTYLDYHFDGGTSNIRIDCQVDLDCKIVDLDYGCGGYKAIHVNNTDFDWENYNEKSLELENELGIIYDCGIPPNKEDVFAICNENKICEVEEK